MFSVVVFFLPEGRCFHFLLRVTAGRICWGLSAMTGQLFPWYPSGFAILAVTTANSIVACQKPKATYAFAKTHLSTSYYMFDRSHWIADLMPFTC